MVKELIHSLISKPAQAQVGNSSAVPGAQADFVMGEELRPYLEPTRIIDSDHPLVAEFAARAAEGAEGPVDAAVRLYLAVRDTIRYDPYCPCSLPEYYSASYVIERGRSFCIPKASLLCAVGRACGIPSRVGFATVKNHLATRQLIEFLGCNLFVYHGFTEFLLEGRWVKATPAFNRELCERHNVPPLEFNGREDSVFQPFNLGNRKYMEYVEDFGSFADVPLGAILAAWRKTYGENFIEKVENMAREKEARAEAFEHEEVLRE
jgi:transglutaminase-like putative cysteine protease